MVEPGCRDIYLYCPRDRKVRYKMYKDCLVCLLYHKCLKHPLKVENAEKWAKGNVNLFVTAFAEEYL